MNLLFVLLCIHFAILRPTSIIGTLILWRLQNRYIRWKTCAITQQISWLCLWGHAMASVSCLLNNLAVTNPPTRRPPTRIVALFRRAWHVSFSIALVPFYIIDFVSHGVCQNWLPPSILVLDYSWIVSKFISVNSLPARTFWRSSFFFCFHLHVFHSLFLHQYPLSLSSFSNRLFQR